MFIYSIETIITILLLSVFVILKIYWGIKDHFKQKKCKHDKYRETMSCDAICNGCGKNLGFIGTVRDRKKKIKVTTNAS